MIIVKRLVREDDGSWTASWAIPPEDMSIIVTAGVNILVSTGVATIEEEVRESSILEHLDETEMKAQ
jgi:hypothetical protein